jgi:branched-chain amino acid transport system permease protein
LIDAAPGLRDGLRAQRPASAGLALALRAVLALAIVLVGLKAPAIIRDPYYIALLINAILLGISATAIGFLARQSGLMMFGAAAFTGAATYIYAIAITRFGFGVLSASTMTLVLSTLVFALVGALIVRARPLPFAMLTLALSQLLRSVVLITDFRPLTGGDDGLPLTFEGTFFGIDQAQMSKPEGFWPVAWLAFCLVITLVWSVGQSRFGRTLRAIRANEERMRFSGFDTYAPRVFAFAISGFIAAVAGLLAGFYTAFASPELLDFSTGGAALVSTLIGGVGAVGGPALGALLYVIGQDRFGATGNLELLTGVGVVLVIFLFPEGVTGFLYRSVARFWPSASS